MIYVLEGRFCPSFCGKMKKELLYTNQFNSIADFKRQLKEYIIYYNKDRIKLRLGMSPMEYRSKYQI